MRGIKIAHEQGWCDRFMLYFMIGQPVETDADVICTAETIRWLKQECRGSRRKPLNLNVTIRTGAITVSLRWFSKRGGKAWIRPLRLRPGLEPSPSGKRGMELVPKLTTTTMALIIIWKKGIPQFTPPSSHRLDTLWLAVSALDVVYTRSGKSVHVVWQWTILD